MNPAMESSRKVKIRIDSTPQGADVEIDGMFYGNTPLEFSFSEGVHEVRISLAGYEAWSKRVNIYEGLSINPVLGKGSN